ncbi:hypothetical protein Goshw_000536 [Gossypium schwendimanii]|uniref:Uncharacterized protein n=1 Tax=Gossypium schwendimanii TaxID=34291 RepID=A0A7J9LSJ4_GOSSC|nr:hypothetical protein [Gossypium schwendimanii]
MIPGYTLTSKKKKEII